MITLTVEIDDKAVRAKLAEIKRRLANPRPLMAGIAAEMLLLTESAFEREGVVGGSRWKPLALSTIAQRERKGQWPGKKLQRSPAGLAASVQPFHSGHQAGLTVSQPYAAIHQFGGKAGRGRKVIIPARPYLPVQGSSNRADLTSTARDSIQRMLADFVSGT